MHAIQANCKHQSDIDAVVQFLSTMYEPDSHSESSSETTKCNSKIKPTEILLILDAYDAIVVVVVGLLSLKDSIHCRRKAFLY